MPMVDLELVAAQLAAALITSNKVELKGKPAEAAVALYRDCLAAVIAAQPKPPSAAFTTQGRG